jgi:hypothetical protein
VALAFYRRDEPTPPTSPRCSPSCSTRSLPSIGRRATDTQPPSAPTNLHVSDQHCGEVEVPWNQSTANQDPQSAIRYQIFINDVLDPWHSDRHRRTITTYGVDGDNTFVVRAVDSAGNISAPSNSFPIVLDVC